MINLYTIIGQIAINGSVHLIDISTDTDYDFKIDNIDVIKSLLCLNGGKVEIDDKLLIDCLKNVSSISDSVKLVEDGCKSDEDLPQGVLGHFNTETLYNVSIPRVNKCVNASPPEESIDRNLSIEVNKPSNGIEQIYLKKLKNNKRLLAKQRAYMIINRHILGRMYGIDSITLVCLFSVWEDKIKLKNLISDYLNMDKSQCKHPITLDEGALTDYIQRCLDMMKSCLKYLNVCYIENKNAVEIFNEFTEEFTGNNTEGRIEMCDTIKYFYLPSKLKFILDDNLLERSLFNIKTCKLNSLDRWVNNLSLLNEIISDITEYGMYLRNQKQSLLGKLLINLKIFEVEVSKVSSDSRMYYLDGKCKEAIKSLTKILETGTANISSEDDWL